MPRIRWSEKAIRLMKECGETKRSIETVTIMREPHEYAVENPCSGHGVIFRLKDDEIDAEVKLR